MEFSKEIPTAPWLFPAPVRASRFAALSPEWAALNIEVALDKIRPYEFRPDGNSDVLHFDYQTQLDGTYPGRLGSGRGGIYKGFYIKGVGRTPTAANWNQPEERYHGSGHMTVSSAAREYLVTAWLRARGLENTVVGCQAVLAGLLTPGERKAVGGGKTSAHAASKADACMMALSAKPANFTRMTNIVWALDHFGCYSDQIGGLFLELEQQLQRPEDRAESQGDPEQIAAHMDASFRRGIANFRQWARHGIFWMYTQNNFTLDGRFVDLETPLVIGSPMAGLLERGEGAQAERKELGFEEFWFVWYWRLFLAWLKQKLNYLAGNELNLDKPVRLFIKEIQKQIVKQFGRNHLLYADQQLIDEAVKNLNGAMKLSVKGRQTITAFGTCSFERIVLGRGTELPDLGWHTVPTGNQFPFGGVAQVLAPQYTAVKQSEDAVKFERDVASAAACLTPQELFQVLNAA